MSPALDALAQPWRRNYRDISMLIWTTTPWTLPANQALSVNPELEYSLFSFLVWGEKGRGAYCAKA